MEKAIEIFAAAMAAILLQKGETMYAVLLTIALLVISQGMSYWWKIRLEKIAKAERLKKKNEEILEHNRRVRAMPDFCENCKETCMVKIGVAFGNDIKYDRYKCPNCGKIKDVPVGA